MWSSHTYLPGASGLFRPLLSTRPCLCFLGGAWSPHQMPHDGYCLLNQLTICGARTSLSPTQCLAMDLSGPLHCLENPKGLAKAILLPQTMTKPRNQRQITIQGQQWIRAGKLCQGSLAKQVGPGTNTIRSKSTGPRSREPGRTKESQG